MPQQMPLRRQTLAVKCQFRTVLPLRIVADDRLTMRKRKFYSELLFLGWRRPFLKAPFSDTFQPHLPL
jgi:hypothetical protein